MKRQIIFLKKFYAYIWFLLTMLLFVACSNPTLEQSVEPSTGLVISDFQTQQSYPAPEQPVEEQVQSGYPSPNISPIRPTPPPTLVPPPSCDIKPPVEIIMSYVEGKANFPVFSEPIIVATNNVGFSVAEWLPDSQRLLISQGDGAFGTISTLDIMTGEMVEYARRRDVSSFPIWLDNVQGIMFVDATTEGWELQFSNGEEPITLANELASVFIAKDPSSERVVTAFSSEPGALMAVDATGQTSFVTATELNEETQHIPLSSDDGYHLAWSPNGDWLVQYMDENLYLINTQTQRICAFDLGDYGEAGQGRIFYVQWSPDGRYLSMAIKRQNPTPELNILDIDSMELSILSLPLDIETWPPESIGGSVWLLDSQMIFVQVGSYDDETGKIMANWILVDIQTRQYSDVLPNYKFLPGVGNITWSPDGSKVAYSCSTEQEGNICLLNISR